jgi:hypothetical protein
VVIGGARAPRGETNPMTGGSANAAAAQNQADEMRLGKARELFLRRGDWWRLLLAFAPIIAIAVLGIFLL